MRKSYLYLSPNDLLKLLNSKVLKFGPEEEQNRVKADAQKRK